MSSSQPSQEHAHGYESGAGGPVGQAQFWDDFWNTIYQFTHPFSSTFFDSLFSDDSDRIAASTASQSPPHSERPSAGSSADEKQYFGDKNSFEKFWHDLQRGQFHHEGDPTTPLEHIQAAWSDFKSASTGFISSIDWQQNWIQMILAMHFIIFVIIILVRNRPSALTGMLFCTTALSEPLNGIASRHWQRFSDDNYFDQHGVFASLVWAAPLLGNAILAVMLLLRATVQMLVKVKKAQLQESKRKKQK
ncbi:hypothetical protein BGZ99_004459 [Dissophora globulifera]|uniref:Transmembrane protein 18 n=1 Tax=Dissophora globulifera TaxID=979702 RepID=A0A9P6UZ09_9FUNG|nr:hypothetical protein BGZ99_004459 [Dissophora globulifera]